MVLDDLKDQIPLREISRISGISLSGYYYRPVKRHVQGYCIRKTGIQIQESMGNTEESRYKGEPEDCQESAQRQQSEPTCIKTQKENKERGPDQLWETDITCIPTESGMSYLMCIKDCFTKEWLGFHYFRSCMSRYAIRSVENAVLMAFNGTVPEGLVLRTDNGPRYISYEFRNAMRLLGIKLEYIPEAYSEDNGNIESLHNSIKTDYISGQMSSGTSVRHQLPLVRHSLITMNAGLIHPLIIFLQGNSGGSSWMIRHSGKDSLRKKLR